MHITLENMSVEVKSVEKTTNNINETKDCNNNNDTTVLNQDLKNQDVVEFIRVRIAKGVINTNTFKITYLSEYVKSKFSKLIDIKLLSIPSKEKIFNPDVSKVTMLFNLRINWEKLILHPNICSPISRIDKDIRELILIICSQIKYDEFDNMAKINNLNKN